MSTKKDDEKFTGWDSLILITLVGVIATITMALTAGLSWWWPVGYLVAMFAAVVKSVKNDEKEAKSEDKV